MKVCAYDDETRRLAEAISSQHKPTLVRVPGHYWHGMKAIGDEPALAIYFATRLYDYDRPDEENRAWNDPSIVPVEINGNKDDRRVNQAWDWFYPPHR